MLNVSEIAAMDEKAILSKLDELRKEVFTYRMDKKTTGLEKPHLMKAAKKDIARLLTVLNQKKESK